jgi:hypothetical protein
MNLRGDDTVGSLARVTEPQPEQPGEEQDELPLDGSDDGAV